MNPPVRQRTRNELRQELARTLRARARTYKHRNFNETEAGVGRCNTPPNSLAAVRLGVKSSPPPSATTILLSPVVALYFREFSVKVRPEGSKSRDESRARAGLSCFFLYGRAVEVRDATFAANGRSGFRMIKESQIRTHHALRGVNRVGQCDDE